MLDDTNPSAHGPKTVAEILLGLVRCPGDLLWRKWNWKAALLSTMIRGSIFFWVNMAVGFRAAVSALATEIAFRPFIAGFYGAITESFRSVSPNWAGTLAVMLVLPAVNHGIELVAHFAGRTPRLGASVLASASFSALSGLFNLFAMRRGVFIVGEGSRPFLNDLKRIPFVAAAFLIAGPRLAWTFAQAQRPRRRPNFRRFR
ncbi:MAG TPA: hypothetical protein VJX67_13375 [Blastocatellia bacterium]|nr:hypothetical protein [Blastocatellia bacterium]